MRRSEAEEGVCQKRRGQCEGSRSLDRPLIEKQTPDLRTTDWKLSQSVPEFWLQV